MHGHKGHHHNFFKHGISLEGVESEFTNELTKVARTLPKKKFCLKIGRYITNKNDPILKSIWYQGRLKKRRFSCKRKISGTTADDHQDNNNVPSNENQNPMELMVRLYNQLPLPFQCQVLTSATFNYFDKRRKEHISETATIRQNTGVVAKQATTKKQLLKHKLLYHDPQLLESIKKVENVLSVHNVLPVANQCHRLVLKQPAFCKMVKFRVKRNSTTKTSSNASPTLHFEMKIREMIPTIVENYVRRNGIKIGLSLIKRHWVRTLRTLLFVTAKESDPTQEHFIFHVKLFLALGNTGPINGNLVLAALYDYGRERLSQKMGVDLDFGISLENVNYHRHGALSHVEQELFMRQTFPRFLDRYFKGLVVTEQDLILNMVSVYANQTKTKIIHVLQKEHGLKLANLLDRPRNERVVPNFPTLPEKSGKKLAGKVGRIFTIKKLTNIEIIMVAALSSLVFFGFMFVIVFAMFQKRRKEFMQRVQELQQITGNNQQSSTQTLLLSNSNEQSSDTRPFNSSSMTNINNDRNEILTPAASDLGMGTRQCESFFKRTKSYSRQMLEKRESLVRSNQDSIGSTDVETLL